jgi:hypothetical protein
MTTKPPSAENSAMCGLPISRNGPSPTIQSTRIERALTS